MISINGMLEIVQDQFHQEQRLGNVFWRWHPFK
jgi:hypothetical protein